MAAHPAAGQPTARPPRASPPILNPPRLTRPKASPPIASPPRATPPSATTPVAMSPIAMTPLACPRISPRSRSGPTATTSRGSSPTRVLDAQRTPRICCIGGLLSSAYPADASRGGQGLRRFGQDLPAIDDDGLAGDIPCLPGREEGGRVADILDRAQALERDRSRHALEILLAQALQSFRHDVAGQDRVHRDAVFRQLDAGGAHEAELARLGRGIVGPAGIAGDRAGDRGGEDDAALAALLEIRYARLDGQEGALEVGVHHLVPALRGHLLDLALREDAG